FHAIDSPIIDPIALRKAKREKSLTHMTVRSSSTTSPPRSPPKNWVPFSRRDNTALEKAFKSPYASTAVVSVNEDHLFEVDISKREISPVYWEGPVYEVRRATWFYAGEGFKWLPCEENMSRQIEKGYQKYKPYVEPIIVTEEVQMDLGEIGPSSFISSNNNGEKEKDMTDTEKQVEEIIQQKEYLLGPYLGQYVIYTDPVYAWLFQ
ncbi:uncharacterized protein EV154DRAFT_412574, partial [Mucor mucedo]|uniref:uncharacterized protein n=1 Tax=Mucor mucedo TaxID=29922 RepID=UPI0022210D81